MYTSYAPSRRTSEQSHPHEMLQKSRLHDPFFGLKSGFDQRPTSVATEIVDTDWDEEDLISEIEDDDPDSPRISLNSSGQPSLTTLSSYEEALTPRSSRTREAFSFDNDPVKPIKGPRGPHLFRSSMSSSQSLHHQETLTLSPITPKAPNPLDAGFLFPITHEPLPRSRTTPYQFTHERLDTNDLSLWSPEKVAQWMLNAGVEVSIAEKFVENDINGAILITLKFEDLKELSIPSFGVRTKIWEEIHMLRDSKPISPRPETPIEDEESREVRRERRRMEKAQQEAEPDNCEDSGLKRQKSRKRSGSKRQPSHEDIISPMESVSIVGIEQMMPKPHHCSKGENCSKFRRQQRMIEAFKKDHPFVDMDKGGMIMVAGDPGNPSTAQSLNHPPSTEALRPFSEAVPSVVASSDVLGPGIPPLQYLQEAALANLQSRDPQDNVRQFLDFQHQQTGTAAGEVPPTPPFEIYSGSMSPHEGLRALPKLSIPGQQPPKPRMSQQQHMPPSRPSTVQPTQQQTQQQWVPRAMDKADPLSPDLATPTAPYRFGTPFSDMDVPLTAVPLGPVSRDASQSVPPDMNYRAGPANGGPRSQSRTSRRPSFAVMAPLAENVNTPVAMQPSGNSISPPRRTTASPQSQAKAATRSLNPTQAPPRAQYPWSSSAQSKPTAPTAVPAPADRPMPNKAAALLTGGATQDAEGIQYQGPVRKRKTKMLRHEWHDQYATLKGTRLALHKDATTRDRTLEYVDIDDYAIACSSLSSGSKLNAAFKAMSISRSDPKKRRSVDDKDDVAAFSFQLIPQDKEGRILGGRLRKRESTSISGPMPLAAGSNAIASSSSSLSSEAAALQGAVNGTGKTHHFAVKSRDQRIDWMRELMLAKALKQKGEGFEVSVNGNMI